MEASGIAKIDPGSVSRYIARQGLLIQSEFNRDPIAEFCFLVVLLDLKNKIIPLDLGDLIGRVMRNPQPDQVKEAVRRLRDYADFLPSDPRKSSTDVAKAWQESKKIREGKAIEKLDESLLSQPFNSDGKSKDQIPIRVQIWPQTQGELDSPASEIRCAVPGLSMIGNLQNIIRYAASAGFNFPLRNGKLRQKPTKLDLSSQAMLFSRSLGTEWVLRDKATTLGEVLEHSHRLQIVNTKLKNLAVVLVVRFPQERSKHYIFDISKPRDLVSTLRTVASDTHVLRSIELAGSSFFQTRVLTILPEEMPMPSAASSNHNPNVHPIHSSANPSPGAPPSSSSQLHRAAPPVVHAQARPPSAKAHQPEILEAQVPADHRDESLRSSSSSASFHTIASKNPEPTQVHHDSKTGHPAHGTPSAPSINSMSGVSTSSSSPIVVVDPPAAQSAVPSKPPNQTPPTTAAPAQKKGFTPSAPSTNPISAVTAFSSSSMVMVDQSVAPSAILSMPLNQTPPTTYPPAPKKGSDSFYKKVLEKARQLRPQKHYAQAAFVPNLEDQTPLTTDALAQERRSDSLVKWVRGRIREPSSREQPTKRAFLSKPDNQNTIIVQDGSFQGV